jgi:hypothetical protein
MIASLFVISMLYATNTVPSAAPHQRAGASLASRWTMVFRTATIARQHCPSRDVIWIDFTSIASRQPYYKNHDRRFGKTARGAFACLQGARAARLIR